MSDYNLPPWQVIIALRENVAAQLPHQAPPDGEQLTLRLTWKEADIVARSLMLAVAIAMSEKT